MTLWLTMVLTGLITYTIRLSFILLFGRMSVPRQLQRALRFVPAAVLSAIIFPELLFPGGGPEFSLVNNHRLLAGILASLVAWRTKNALFTILVGMLSLIVLQLVLG